MKLRSIYILAAGAMIISCKKELMPQDSASVVDSTATANANTPTAAVATAPSTSTTMAVPPAQPTVQAQPQMQKTAKGMNPPHGQPGHRCDIPVGAPLNSPPGKNAAPQQNVSITPTPTQAQAATPALVSAPAQETAPGMNPPHGQPGHVCSVPVGQPLPKADGTPGGGESK